MTAWHQRSGGWVKICGITSEADANLVIDAEADAIGINIWPNSPRSVTVERAQALAEHTRGRILRILVTVDLELSSLSQAIAQVQPDAVQLHGDESPELLRNLAALHITAYKAVGLAEEADLVKAIGMPGPLLLADARDDVQKGGTGKAPPAALAQRICASRQTILAGGLHADNVAAAIQAYRPWGVDAASGLEASPGHKDAEKVRAFVTRARQAWRESASTVMRP